MPLRWKIAPLEHMVVCVFEGVVTMADIMAYFAALEQAGAVYYRKILDATRGECRLSEDELARMASHARAADDGGTPGPMAVVTGSSGNDTVVRNLRAMTPPTGRLRVFATIHEARRWLTSVPIGRPAGGARLA